MKYFNVKYERENSLFYLQQFTENVMLNSETHYDSVNCEIWKLYWMKTIKFEPVVAMIYY